MKALGYDELRALHWNFLQGQNLANTTVNTSVVDAFYIWRKVSKELFWKTVTDSNFESEARSILTKALTENS